MSLELFAQGIGIVGLLLGLFAFMQSDDNRMKGILAVSSIVFTLHFALLGALVAAATMGLTAVRVWVSMYSRSWSWMLVFIAAQMLLSITLMSEWLEIMPLLNGLLGTFAMFRLAGIPLRLAMLACGLLGIGYNVAIGSVGGSVMDTIVFVINVATIARLRNREAQAASD